MVPVSDVLDPGCHMGSYDCGTVLDGENGKSTIYNMTVQSMAYQGTGQILHPNMADFPFRDHARLAVEWLSREQDPFLRSGIKVDVSADRFKYDFIFCMEPQGLGVKGFHMRPTFFLAAVSMATGWEVDDKVRKRGVDLDVVVLKYLNSLMMSSTALRLVFICRSWFWGIWMHRG